MIRFALFTVVVVSVTGFVSGYLLWFTVGALVPGVPSAPGASVTGTSAAPPGDLSERLRRRKDDRDNKLRQARMEVHPHANKFLRELEGYESAANYNLNEWMFYFQEGPRMAALGIQLPAPPRFDLGLYVKQIKLAKEDFVRGVEQCRVKIEQIEFEYYKDLAALQQGTAEPGKRPPAPETAVDGEVLLAQRLLPVTADVVNTVWDEYNDKFQRSRQSYQARINVLPLYTKAARTGEPFPSFPGRGLPSRTNSARNP